MEIDFFNHINDLIKDKIPFVVYKKPNDELIALMHQNDDTLHAFTDFNIRGFVFAPFDERDNAFYIKQEKEIKTNIDVITDVTLSKNKIKTNISDSDRHQQLVRSAIDEIHHSNIHKIVISRKESHQINSLDPTTVFKRLVKKYENAFVYLLFHPKLGMWSGATPETLLKVKNNTFTTMALASTQVYKGDLNTKWGDKELKEQQMVADYINVALNKACIQFKVSPIETIKAGSLLHLKTNFTGILPNENNAIKNIVAVLHPTPAVCGMPKKESKAYILKNENYNRSFYTGFLGEIMENEVSLFVNLRCYHYQDKMLNLFIGGGITEESHPEKEWLETVAKSKTIISVL